MSRTLLNAKIIGHVGNVRFNETNDGTAVLNLTVAHNGARGGEEYTEWVDVSIWGKLADAVEPYVKKGMRVYADGEARVRTFEYKGESRATLEITCRNFVMLDSKDDEVRRERPARREERREKTRPERGRRPARQRDAFNDKDDDEDLF